MPRPAHLTREVQARFVAKVDVSIGGCWRWKASRNPQGYGYFKLGDRYQLAHRVAWQLWKGRIPKGLCVLHRCDNPSCVRPSHLFLGTRKDNAQDAVAKGRNSPPPVHTKLSDEAVAIIRASTAGPSELGRLYGVSREQIRRIKNGSSR